MKKTVWFVLALAVVAAGVNSTRVSLAQAKSAWCTEACGNNPTAETRRRCGC